MPGDITRSDQENEDDGFNLIPVDPKVERFLGAAVARIRLVMLVMGAMGTAIAWSIWDWRIAAGVLLGCIVSYVNFRWLEGALNTLTERISSAGTKVSSTGTVLRFLLRYAFIGIGAYAIFKGYPASLYGFLAGLSLTVAAILCEAVFEAYSALRSEL